MTDHTRASTPTPDADPSMPRSRRAILAGAVGSVAALIATRLGNPDAAAAGDPLILGNTANTAGTANTTLATTSSGTALLINQLGTGTALRGSAVGPGSIAGFFTAPLGTGVSGVTGANSSPGVYSANDAATYGGGTALRAAGKHNHGLIATTEEPLADAVRAVHTGSGAAIRATAFGGVGIEAVGATGMNAEATAATANGVYGLASATTGASYGVRGTAASTTGAGVRGDSTAATGNSAGVIGTSASVAGAGVVGNAASTTGFIHGVLGFTTSTTELASGVSGMSGASTGSAVGVYGTTQSGEDSAGVLGWALASTGNSAGVTGFTGSGDGVGVFGLAGPSPSIGVLGSGTGNGFGVYSDGRAHVQGTLDVTDALTKGGGSFKIDHPLDPANKFLYHSFVESPDMKNIYDGVVTLDGDGTATVELPDWFEALNRDVRYQLTPIGEYAPLFVRSKVDSGRFSIAGGTAGQEVSWQVTGIRKDAWAEAHRIPVEEDKKGDVKGRYLHPLEHGQKASKGIKPPKAAQRALAKPAKAPKAPKFPA